MASKTAILSVRIISDAKKAVAGFAEAASGVEKLEKRVSKLAAPAAAAAAGVIALGKTALDSASALQQSTGAVESVFKQQQHAIKALAADAAGAVGLSANQYQEFAAVIGSQLKNLGTTQAELVPTTDKLISMGADLASMYGGTTAEAVSALSAAFRGETDPIERYGITIKKADINARLAADGLAGLEGPAARQAEAQALLAMLTEQSADALGNFARETDTAAGSWQIAAANWENAKAALGEALLPMAAAVSEKLASLAQVVQRHPGAFQALAAAVLIAAGAIFSLLGIAKVIAAFSALRSAITAITAAQAALNIVMTANPIGLIVVAVAALAAALVVAYQRSETFRNVVQAAGALAAAAFQAISDRVRFVIAVIAEMIGRAGGIGGAFQAAMRIAAAAVDLLTAPIRSVIALVSRLISAISSIRFPSPPAWFRGGLTASGVGGGGTLTAAGGGSILGRRALAPTTTTPATYVDNSVSIRVDGSGIVDPRAVATAIREALRQDGRARGGIVAAGGRV